MPGTALAGPGLPVALGTWAPEAANAAAHCSVLVPGQDEAAEGSCWGCQHPLSPQPGRTPMLGGGFLHEVGWLAPPSPFPGRATPVTQELPPQGPFPTVGLCLVSLH